MEQYYLEDVLDKLQITRTALAELLGIHANSPAHWSTRRDGLIPEQYNARIDELLAQGDPSGEDGTPSTFRGSPLKGDDAVSLLAKALARTDGSVTKLAKKAGVSASALYTVKNTFTMGFVVAKALTDFIEGRATRKPPTKMKEHKKSTVDVETIEDEKPTKSSKLVALIGTPEELVEMLSKMK